MNEKLQQLKMFDCPEPEQSPLKLYSKYQRWKHENGYRKAENKNQCCKYCIYLCANMPSTRAYYKCMMLGVSGSSATDVRLSYVCNLFERVE